MRKGKSDFGRLSGKEWLCLRDWVSIAVGAYAPLACQRYIQSVVAVTLQHSVFQTEKWAIGDLSYCIMKSAKHRGQWHAELRRAVDLGFLQEVHRATETFSYRVNVPGVLQFLQPIAEKRTESGELLCTILNKVTDYWKEQKWDVEPIKVGDAKMKRIEQELMKSEERTKESKQQRLERRSQQNLRVTWIRDFLSSLLEEEGERYLEEWKSRTYGDARNWLTYCEQMGMDPRKTLQEVVSRWGEFRRGQLQTERGAPILLRPSMTFSQFYKYRILIYDWLELHPASETFSLMDIIEVVNGDEEVENCEE